MALLCHLSRQICWRWCWANNLLRLNPEIRKNMHTTTNWKQVAKSAFELGALGVVAAATGGAAIPEEAAVFGAGAATESAALDSEATCHKSQSATCLQRSHIDCTSTVPVCSE